MGFISKIKNGVLTILHKYFLSSVKSTMLSLFIPVMILFIVTASLFSYTLSSRQINENAYANMMDTASQTKNFLNDRLGNLFEQFVGFSNDIREIEKQAITGSLALSGQDYVKINNRMEEIYSANYKMLDSILLYINNGKALMTKNDHAFIPSHINFDYEAWQANDPEKMAGYRWSNLHSNTIFNNPGHVVSVFKLIGDEKSPNQGIILFNIRESFFKDILDNPKISKHGYIALLSDDGIMSFKTLEDAYLLDAGILNELRNRRDAEGTLLSKNVAGTNLRTIYSTIEMNGWRVVVVIPESEIFSNSRHIKTVTLYMAIILTVIAGFLSYFLAQTITKPIAVLTGKVQLVRGGNMNTPFDLAIKNEIGILNNGIRDMMIWIKDLLRQVKEEQEQKRNSELKALMAQINPHFLYNTLYSIKQLCDMNESASASKMVMALSSFFRTGISGGHQVISIAEEVEHVKNYLFIQEMRYSDQLKYTIEVDDRILHCKTIKLLLQPLVENALYHGVKQKREGGIIRIKGYRSAEDIVYEVSDNGQGMSIEKLAEVRGNLDGKGNSGHSTSYGLRNVNERIKLHYGKQYGLEIDSVSGHGTVARMIIPVVDI